MRVRMDVTHEAGCDCVGCEFAFARWSKARGHGRTPDSEVRATWSRHRVEREAKGFREPRAPTRRVTRDATTLTPLGRIVLATGLERREVKELLRLGRSEEALMAIASAR